MKTLNEIREERQANAAKRVAELAKKKKELDELRNAFNKAVDAYNALTVNGIDHEKRA